VSIKLFEDDRNFYTKQWNHVSNRVKTTVLLATKEKVGSKLIMRDLQA